MTYFIGPSRKSFSARPAVVIPAAASGSATASISERPGSSTNSSRRIGTAYSSIRTDSAGPRLNDVLLRYGHDVAFVPVGVSACRLGQQPLAPHRCARDHDRRRQHSVKLRLDRARFLAKQGRQFCLMCFVQSAFNGSDRQGGDRLAAGIANRHAHSPRTRKHHARIKRVAFAACIGHELVDHFGCDPRIALRPRLAMRLDDLLDLCVGKCGKDRQRSRADAERGGDRRRRARASGWGTCPPAARCRWNTGHCGR